MNILVINSGSSSIKYQLIDMTDETVLCTGLVERIGEAVGTIVYTVYPDTEAERKFTLSKHFVDHVAGMEHVVALLVDGEKGVIKDKSKIFGIGHRVLLGGEEITQPVVVDKRVKKIIRKYFPLGPLHNPANLAGIEVAEKLFEGIPNVGVFDTEFHQTMPPKAFLYPLPHELYKDLNIRRYGFHGTSHSYVAKSTAEYLGKPLEDLTMITCHLGNGCSMAAIKNGKCIDTTMGITPLEGLMMGTRCGSIDPAIVHFVMDKKRYSVEQIDNLMNKRSGLKGVSGLNDMRDIHAERLKGNEQAQLAFDMFTYRIKKAIGEYIAILGPIDALVFTAGIGENDVYTRAEVCANMEHLGICVDDALNAVRNRQPRHICKDSKVAVLVVPTNEELEIARATLKVLE